MEIVRSAGEAAGAAVFRGGPVPANVCRRIRAAMDRGAAAPAGILGEVVVEDEEARRAREVDLDEATLALAESVIENLRGPVERFFATRLGPREGVGALRYQPGGFYGPHRDRAHVGSWPGAARRRIAVVLFLNTSLAAAGDGEFDEGLLRVYPSEGCAIDIAPREGLVVAFPADLLHEVTPVAGGTRDALVDWFY
jgi:predicted 2-oxoglutarate/Fe(II)-dependent dioxygenase YbiX